MKIALFHNLSAGGAKRALYEHARQLRARGHTLDAFIPSTADESYLPLAPLCENISRYTVPAAASNRLRRLLSRLVHHPVTRRITGFKAYQQIGEGLKVWQQADDWQAMDVVYTNIARDIDAGGYDLAYVHQCRRTVSPSLLRWLRTPSLYYCQDSLRGMYEWSLGEDEDESYTPHRRCGSGGDSSELPRETLLQRRMLGRTVPLSQFRYLRYCEHKHTVSTRAACRVLANSFYSREAILRSTGVNASVSYLGVDSDFYCPDAGVAREPSRVLSVGAIMPHKRHGFVIRAISRIPEARRPSLQIVGYEQNPEITGPIESRLRDLAERCGVRISFIKDGSDETVRDAYRRASVVAFAPYLEPFGLVALEAMSCGTPVVGICEGGVRETVQDGQTGFLAERDPDAFGAALDRILSDRELAAQMGRIARQAACDRWSWERSVDTLERHLRETVSAATTAPA